MKTFALKNLGKERQAAGPGAKVGNNGAAELSPRPTQSHNHIGKSRGATTANFRGLNANIFPGREGNNFSGNGRNKFRGELQRVPAFELTTHDWDQASAEAISAFMRDERLTAKDLGQLIGCSDRTVENYLSGRTSPRGVFFLRCLAAIPPFEALVQEVCGKAGGIDPRAFHRATKLAREAALFLSSMGGDVESDSSDFTGEDRDLLTGDLFGGHC